MQNQRVQDNKRNAIKFYEMAFNDCKPAEAVKRYVGSRYIQHNPDVEDGKQAFIEYFDQMAEEFPGKKVIINKAIAEGNLVALHCLQKWPGDDDYASIDIFRFDEDGKIVEHWDVLQKIPNQMAHNNGMF